MLNGLNLPLLAESEDDPEEERSMSKLSLPLQGKGIFITEISACEGGDPLKIAKQAGVDVCPVLDLLERGDGLGGFTPCKVALEKMLTRVLVISKGCINGLNDAFLVVHLLYLERSYFRWPVLSTIPPHFGLSTMRRDFIVCD